MPTPIPTPDLTLAGVPWDGTLLAAIIAAGVALIAALLSALSWLFTHRQIDRLNAREVEGRNRTEAFLQYHSAIANIASGNPDLVDRGLDVIEMLMESEWVDSSARDLATLALDAYTRPRSSVPAGGAS